MSAFYAAGVICLILLVGIVFDIGRDVRKIRRAVVERKFSVLGGYLTFPNSLTDDEAERIRQRFEDARNERVRPIWTEGGSPTHTTCADNIEYVRERFGDPAAAFVRFQTDKPHWYRDGGDAPERSP